MAAYHALLNPLTVVNAERACWRGVGHVGGCVGRAVGGRHGRARPVGGHCHDASRALMLPGSSRRIPGKGMIIFCGAWRAPSGNVSLLWVRIEPSGCFWRGRGGAVWTVVSAAAPREQAAQQRVVADLCAGVEVADRGVC